LIYFSDYLVEEALVYSLLWIEQLIFDFSSARYAVLRTFCVSAHKEEIPMRKFISSGVFVKLLVRLTNRLFTNRKKKNKIYFPTCITHNMCVQ